jgi:hypothetical protein
VLLPSLPLTILLMQSKRKSMLEATVNTFAGLAVSFGIQLVIYPVMNIPVRIEQNIVITLIFTLASIGRGYVVRRIFNSKC